MQSAVTGTGQALRSGCVLPSTHPTPGRVAEKGRRFAGGGVDICHTLANHTLSNAAENVQAVAHRGAAGQKYLACELAAAIYKSWSYSNLSLIYKT